MGKEEKLNAELLFKEIRWDPSINNIANNNNHIFHCLHMMVRTAETIMCTGWKPVLPENELTSKLAVLVHRWLHGTSPSNLADENSQSSEIVSRCSLRSSSSLNLNIFKLGYPHIVSVFSCQCMCLEQPSTSRHFCVVSFNIFHSLYTFT